MIENTPSDTHLNDLERDIRQLQIEFARYFAGDRDRPPLEMREELANRVQFLRSRQGIGTAERYRLTALISRFQSLNELSDRRMRKHSTRIQQRSRPADAVIAGSERGSKAMRRLFLELYSGEKAPANMRNFGEYLERKVTEIRTRTGCSSVQFRVIESNGKRSLKAKPLGRLENKTPTDGS